MFRFMSGNSEWAAQPDFTSWRRVPGVIPTAREAPMSNEWYCVEQYATVAGYRLLVLANRVGCEDEF
jgi:hypothetical protein